MDGAPLLPWTNCCWANEGTKSLADAQIHLEKEQTNVQNFIIEELAKLVHTKYIDYNADKNNRFKEPHIGLSLGYSDINHRGAHYL